jgi:phosphoglycerol transferase MdoB-like AlkP superfamily enzyme
MKTNNLFITVCKFIFLTLTVLFCSRLYLLIDHFERFYSLPDAAWVLLQGLRVDLIIVGYFFTVPLLISVWLSKGGVSRLVTFGLNAWLIASFSAIVFMEVITPEFILEYDIRPNRLFIDYLAYPGEVSSMLWEGYKPAIFLGLFTLAVCIAVGKLMVRSGPFFKAELNVLQRTIISCFILVLGFAAMRSSIQHRPFNPSMVYFSNDNLVNSLALNSAYSVLYASYNMGSERKSGDLYGKVNTADVIKKIRESSEQDLSLFVSEDIPTLRYRHASYKGKPKNVVILLQESLGSRYVGSLGGENLTPNLDRLMPQGWKFNKAYATGTRSVRGIEAVMTGFSPGPSRSVVKLSKSQTNFFSIASLLKEHGYFTQFIYGGESHFDNMKSFFLGNGVEDIHDISRFEKPHFNGSWGASDEDLYQEAHRQFEELSKHDEPFFSLVFTTSNHSPWEFPDSCNENMQGPKQTRENAIRYSDCALGKFFAQAKQSNYWDNTIFLVIADHDSRAYGSELVPIEHFKIPALIIGNNIAPRQDDRLVSQIDFAPTMLSLAGISDYHPMIGYDLSTEIPSSRQRAIMQYGENFAWMDSKTAVVYRPNLSPKVFSHDGTHLLAEIRNGVEEGLLEKVQANALWSSLAYQKGFYRLPAKLDVNLLQAKVLNKNNSAISTN